MKIITARSDSTLTQDQIEFLEETSAADLLDDDSNTSGVDRATVNKIFEKI